MNWKRIVGGGLAAGVLNIASGLTLAHFFFAAEVEAVLKRLNLTFGPEVAIQHLLMRLGMGIAVTWLYAAIRPRFGPGPRTALVAGTAMWLFAYVWSLAGMRPYQIFPDRLFVIAVVWG